MFRRNSRLSQRNEVFCRLIRDRCEISLLISIEFERISYFLFLQKSSKSLWFTDDFRGNRSYIICANLVNIGSGVWRYYPLEEKRLMKTWKKWKLLVNITVIFYRKNMVVGPPELNTSKVGALVSFEHTNKVT